MKKTKNKKMLTKSRFFPNSIADSDGPARWDPLWIKDHSRNTVSYPKSLRIQAFESLDGYKMYYATGASVSSLHRASTDSLILLQGINNHRISSPAIFGYDLVHTDLEHWLHFAHVHDGSFPYYLYDHVQQLMQPDVEEYSHAQSCLL